MAKSRFVYVTYIRTTPEKLWQALLGPEFTRQYWSETWHDCEWKPGAAWRLMLPDGRVADSGEILEIVPEKRLVWTWKNEFKPELREEGHSRDGRLARDDQALAEGALRGFCDVCRERGPRDHRACLYRARSSPTPTRRVSKGSIDFLACASG
jgi:uncharacterized protein YndB with AHSA1/START domain